MPTGERQNFPSGAFALTKSSREMGLWYPDVLAWLTSFAGFTATSIVHVWAVS